MNRGKTISPIAAAFATSLIGHLVILVGVRLPAPASVSFHEDLKENLVRVQLEDRQTLGIAALTPPSPAWIGFDQYEPQKATPAQMDQAAFTDHSDDAVAPSTNVEPLPTETNQHEVALEDQKSTERNETMEVAQTPAAQTPTTEVQEDRQPIPIDPLRQLLAALKDAPLAPPPAPQAPANSISTPMPAQADAAPSESEVGARADKQSDPSSIIDVPRDQWQLGKPLAAHGLELKPRRPTISVLTMMTAAPGNPMCRINFGRDGVPTAAAIVQSCGDQRVDDAILASLYRWRAEGDELRRLKEKESVEVRIRLILTTRRLG